MTNTNLNPNHIDKDEIWTDMVEKKRLYFKGTGIILRKELERQYANNWDVQEDRIQVLELTNKETGQKVNVYNVYEPSDVGRWQTKVYLTLTSHIEKEPDKQLSVETSILWQTIDSKNVTNFELTPAAKNWRAFTKSTRSEMSEDGETH